MEENKENINIRRVPSRITRRTPLKTLASSNYQQNAEKEEKAQGKYDLFQNDLAGPSHGGKVDTRYVTPRGLCCGKENHIDLAGPSYGGKFDTSNVTFRNKEKRDENYEDFWKEVVLASTQIPEQTAEIEETLVEDNSVLNRGLHSEDIIAHLDTPEVSCYLKILDKSLVIHYPAGIDQLDQAAYAVGTRSYLQNIEKKLSSVPLVRSASRSCLINWLISINGESGNPMVIEVACWYLDSYLATKTVAVTKLQLIAAACYWIASKVHGNHRHISATRLVKYSGSAFLETDLVAAERSVLRIMGFQANPVTPYEFIPYFSRYCDEDNSGLLEAAALFLCQCAVMVDKEIFLEYPSVIAAAAVNNAVTLIKDNVSMCELQSCAPYIQAEKKARDLCRTCARMLEALRCVCSEEYEYKAPLKFKAPLKVKAPPHAISDLMARALKRMAKEKNNKTDFDFVSLY